MGECTCSALTGEGVKKLFDMAIDSVLTTKMIEHGRQIAEQGYNLNSSVEESKNQNFLAKITSNLPFGLGKKKQSDKANESSVIQ
jgi:hypothetical protein